jgi:predicted ABC-type transport system involved in lysophospholipase L1 biosynthesis ATPase subunit
MRRRRKVATMRRAAVATEGLTKTFPLGGGEELTALDDVTIDLDAGAALAVTGPSGSGKSTLLHLLGGLDRPTRGQIHLQGHDLSGAGQRVLTVLRRDRIGVVFQAYNLLPTLTVAENVRLPLALAGRKPDPAWLEHLVASLGLVSWLGHRSGADHQAGAAVGRRAHRCARLGHRRRPARSVASHLPRHRPDDGDGDPRPPGSLLRAADRVPRRRPGDR